MLDADAAAGDEDSLFAWDGVEMFDLSDEEMDSMFASCQNGAQPCVRTHVCVYLSLCVCVCIYARACLLVCCCACRCVFVSERTCELVQVNLCFVFVSLCVCA